MDRRTFLRLSVATGAATVLPWYLWGSRSALAAPAVLNTPLAIPPLLTGRSEGDQRVYDLTLQSGSREFFSGYQTPTIGINGPFLGPVLRARSGESVAFNVTNQLDEDSTLHWHGLRLPGEMDGGPHQVIAPGATWTPRFTIHQPASTQWFHSHAWHRTGSQVYKGLAGLFYIDDSLSESLNLPNEYGVDDIPLVLQDRSFNSDGSFRYVDNMHQRMSGMLGDVTLVNGTVGAHLQAVRNRLRLRLLNGSNARIYNLSFSDGRKFHQIATDGGLLAAPVTLSQLRLAPGERAELVVDIHSDDNVVLRHAPLRRRIPMMRPWVARSDAESFDILGISGTANSPAGAGLPDRLVPGQELKPESADATRRFVLNTRMMAGSTINGRQIDLQRIDHRVRLGDIEIWEFENRSPMPHPMHVHGVQFQIISRNRAPPPANERGLKDTVLVDADETVQVIVKFDDPADDRHPFMFHCHNLEHEDAGMMGQFVVTA